MVLAAEVVLSSKGQMTLPKEMRDHLRLHTGDKVDVVMRDDHIVISPKISLDALCGILPRPKKALTLEEMDRAIETEVSERVKRTVSRRSS